MTRQTFDALAFIRFENMDTSLWDVVPLGHTAWMYTMKQDDEIIELPAHVSIWYTERMYEGEQLSLLKSAPITLDLEDEEGFRVAIFPIEFDEENN